MPRVDELDPLTGGELRPPRSVGLDRAVAQLAARQHGVVSRPQLLRLGHGGRAIESRVLRAHLHPFHRGAYAVGHPRLGRSGRWMAAVLACGEEAPLGYRSAGAAWGLL